jgi:hypothetical protein
MLLDGDPDSWLPSASLEGVVQDGLVGPSGLGDPVVASWRSVTPNEQLEVDVKQFCLV